MILRQLSALIFQDGGGVLCRMGKGVGMLPGLCLLTAVCHAERATWLSWDSM